MYVVPMTLLIIFVIIYLNTKSVIKTLIVFLAVPFSLVGAFWLLYLLGYNLSIAVWVGVIALAGVGAETGVVMLLYLDVAYEEAVREGRLHDLGDLTRTAYEGAVKRVRPTIMTASVIFAGLLPIMWSQGAGADVMKRIAAPMVGGIVTSVIVVLLTYPAIYYIWRGWTLPKAPAVAPSEPNA
jgi:copper/silver efflux system protein